MPSRKFLVSIAMSIITLPSYAETITNWQRIIDDNKCAPGEAGFFLWDSKKCLFNGNQGNLILDGKKLSVKKISHVDIHVRQNSPNPEGNKYLETYSGDGFILRLTLTYLPGCYESEQCTFSRYFAEFEVIYADKTKKPLKYQGVGFAGS